MTRGLIRGGQGDQSRRRRWDRSRGQSDVLLPLRLKVAPRAKGCRWPLEARKSKETDSPLRPPEGTHFGQHLDFGFLIS